MAKEKKDPKEPKAEKVVHATKEEARQAALAALNKRYGTGTVFEFAKHPLPKIACTPSGSISLDVALGGGYPRGRIVEIFGPEASGKTTLTLHAIAEIQKLGGAAAFVDAEHALAPDYARSLGVDMDKLYLSQPDSAEQALTVMEELVSSGGFDIVVLDSVAALVPQAELDAEMGTAQMGLQARLMSQALRKLTAIADKTNTIIFFINQLRMKIGVMFGCFHADTLVTFADGSSHSIKEVVSNKLTGPVFAWDETTKQFVAAPITAWHNNGKVENSTQFLHVETESVDGRGRFGFTATPDHEVLTNAGWKPVKALSITDKLVSKYQQQLNGTFADFVWGTLVGDSHLSVRHKNTAALKLRDKNNPAYIIWKADKLANVLPMHCTEYEAHSDYTYELAKVEKELNTTCRRDPLVFLEHHYSDLGMAVWFMDDANFDDKNSHCRATLSVKRCKGDVSRLQRVKCLIDTHLGLSCEVDVASGAIRFNKDAFAVLCSKIAQYVPPCMQYKLPDEHRGMYLDFALSNTSTLCETFVNIVELREASARQMRQKDKYDITVANQHTYLVGGYQNGVVVHNSPETTTGGNALKFYASQRLDIRKKEAIKEGDRVVGNLTHVKIVKNKIAPPFREVDFEIYYGKGVSKSNDIATLGVYYNLIDKSGAFYSYQGERIAQGHKKLCAYLEEHEDLMVLLEAEIKKQARIPEAAKGSQTVPLTEPVVFEAEEEIPDEE